MVATTMRSWGSVNRLTHLCLPGINRTVHVRTQSWIPDFDDSNTGPTNSLNAEATTLDFFSLFWVFMMLPALTWAEVVRLHGNEHNLPAYLVSPEWMFSMYMITLSISKQTLPLPSKPIFLFQQVSQHISWHYQYYTSFIAGIVFSNLIFSPVCTCVARHLGTYVP